MVARTIGLDVRVQVLRLNAQRRHLYLRSLGLGGGPLPEGPAPGVASKPLIIRRTFFASRWKSPAGPQAPAC